MKLNTVNAEHLTGGEMRYSYINTLPNGRQIYEISVLIYRDALGGGANFDDPLYTNVVKLSII